VVEKKKRKRNTPPEGFEDPNATAPPSLPPSLLPEGEITPEEEKLAGKFIRPLRRARPEVYEMLEELERTTGRKKTLIVSEALHHYILERKLIQSNLTVADLWEAWDLFVVLQEHAVRNFLRMGQLVFSEEYQSLLELARTMQGPMPPPEKVRAVIPSRAEKIREELLEKMWNYMEPMVEWCMEQVIRNMAKAMNLKTPPKMPVGEKIPVRIIEEEEKED